MPDILQDLPLRVPRGRAFAAVSTPAGLNSWWTEEAAGRPELGAAYALRFGPEYAWSAEVTRCAPDAEFELTLTRADADWLGTRVGFVLETRGDHTWLRFRHAGWPAANEHYRVSAHCWALYLRLLRRAVECGEVVAYEDRLSA